MSKELAFSITHKDCRMQTFRSGGKGWQNQNKRDTGVRFVHDPSGATGESREHRTQLENKRAAFKRMTEDPKFRIWINIQLYGLSKAEQEVAKMMEKDEDFLVEDMVNGKWVKRERE
jgi:protein subunit release factor B